jgi:hypothetical protein
MRRPSLIIMTNYIEFVEYLRLKDEAEPPIMYSPVRVQLSRQVTHIAASTPASFSSELSEGSFQGMSDIDICPQSSSEIIPILGQFRPNQSSDDAGLTTPNRSEPSAEETTTHSSPLMDDSCCTCSLQ